MILSEYSYDGYLLVLLKSKMADITELYLTYDKYIQTPSPQKTFDIFKPNHAQLVHD